MQATFKEQVVRLPTGKRCTVALWDTAGQERFHALSPIYYRDANGAILVYDITDNKSFTRVTNWVKELRSVRGNDIDLVIAGNKIDLEKHRAVNKDEAIAYAKTQGAEHFDTSAKLNKGIHELFGNLAKKMMEHGDKGPGNTKKHVQLPLIAVF
eukprot:CAMPEP_0168539708 /NCGR_PEP_ID=MMETSP0405-20121227/22001_1 /TAXON_ID=498012 /ORGANISM="Trichosphaerium sp, Strain Am-I-7 wt" /LENGTH=153 /DNA_ID=CAMNT_0008569347 /DNA_START=75 /DNA_END=536 /DNA_ORIENTATION=-